MVTGLSAVPQVWLTHAGVIRAARLIASGQREVRSAVDWPAAAAALACMTHHK